MERVPVNSSNIVSVGHDNVSTLEVEFLNGSIYQYHEVPIAIYHELISASSVGGYLAQHVKNTYGYSRIK